MAMIFFLHGCLRVEKLHTPLELEGLPRNTAILIQSQTLRHLPI